MSWNTTLTTLQFHLAELFPLQEDIFPLAEKAGLSRGQIAISDKGIGLWYNVLTEARQRDVLDKLIEEARRMYPEDKILQTLSGELIGEDHEIRLDLVRDSCIEIIHKHEYIMRSR